MKHFYIITAITLSLLAILVSIKEAPKIVYSITPTYKVDQDLLGLYDEKDTQASFWGNYFTTQDFIAMRPSQPPNVLGVTNEYKRIEVDLTNQRLYAYEGGNKIYDFLISSGKWGRTPTCTAEENCRIWTKLRYTKMSGGNKALGTYYYLPNVPYTMYFGGKNIPAAKGYGIHGTYWHNNFGHPMSHGCINMKTEEAEKIFYWANPTLAEGQKTIRSSKDNPGTQIIIYGVAPNE